MISIEQRGSRKRLVFSEACEGIRAILRKMDDGEKANAEPKAIEDFAARPSTLPDIGIDLYGFATTELANAVGEAVQCWLHVFGKLLNLKRLLQIIVAFNYNEKLANLDRGTKVSRPLAATDDGIAVGIAMTPTVLREGEPRSVMVLNAAYMSVFAQKENPELEAAREQMVYTLAHECGHVHDLEVQASSLPGIILNTELPFRDGILFLIASGCWEEYIACRLSSFMGNVSTLRAMEDTFCGALERAKDRANTAIRQYRMHGDVGRVTNEVTEEYRKIMVYASYLLGHVDGLNQAVEDAAPKAIGALAKHGYFGPFFSKLRDDLRAMHSTYGEWKGLHVFEPLKQLAYELLKHGGIDIQTRSDGTGYVDVPFTPDTIPTMEEQMTFLAQGAKAKQA